MSAGKFLAGLVYCLTAPALLGCGPDFPNYLLAAPDQSVLAAPEASFSRELVRMKLLSTEHQAVPARGYAEQTLAVELADLQAALEQAGMDPARCRAICDNHRLERAKISLFAQTNVPTLPSTNRPSWQQSAYLIRPDPTNPNSRIPGPLPQLTPGLPGEFADYFQGAVAWHQLQFDPARLAWQRLLARPIAERHYKSTWAAFMLGKSWEEENRRRAIARFRQVRSLATNGFADSLGLAAASLGYEARLHWREGRYAQAMDLWLEQEASGDPGAFGSLRFAAEAALHLEAGSLTALARHTRAQRILTAYVISTPATRYFFDADGPVREQFLNWLERASGKSSLLPKPTSQWHKQARPIDLWLEAVEKADVKDVASAEQLALAAYQAGDMDRARRWLQRAAHNPVAQWLRAKLLLRDGQVDQAALILSRLARLFPLAAPETNLTPAGLIQNLSLSKLEYYPFDRISAVERIHAEWGVIKLARGQYVEALDALLRSGFWTDAAYVAERTLTAEELQRYVDLHWPAPPSGKGVPASPAAEDRSDVDAGAAPGSRLRYLLARRLARARRLAEARRYFPGEWLPEFDAYCTAIETARQPDLPAEQRARALWEAARLTRYDGLELFGTEVEPDWHVHGGNFEVGPTLADRVPPETLHLQATRDEIERASRDFPEPNTRWHYRWSAAELGWEAAQLLPDGRDETARVLCIAGTWLKNIDPGKADRFYKALVRRCGETTLGAEAGRRHWFPPVDREGNLLSEPEAKGP